MSAPPEAVSTANGTAVQVVWVALPDPTIGMWAGVAIGFAMLAAAAALALRRAKRAGESPPQRSTRIYRTAFTGAGAMTAMWAPHEILLSSGDPPLAAALFVNFAGLALAAMVLLGLADYLFGIFHPRRSRRWLMIAPPLFIFYAAAILAIFSPPPEMSLPQLMVALSLAAAAIIWWSHLPAPEGDATPVPE